GKHQPDRMQADVFANEFGRQHIAFEELTDDEDRQHENDRKPAWPELDDGDDHADDQSGERADIGNEGEDPGGGADEKTEVQRSKREADGVVDAEDQTHERLAA